MAHEAPGLRCVDNKEDVRKLQSPHVSARASFLYGAALGVESHYYYIKNQWLKGIAFEALPLFIP